MLNPSNAATLTYKRIASGLGTVYEDMALLPMALAPAPSEVPTNNPSPEVQLQMRHSGRLEELLAPAAGLMEDLLEPEYRCMVVGQKNSGGAQSL